MDEQDAPAFATRLDYLESLVKQVGGVDVSKVMADRNSPAALAHVRAANAEAARLHVNGAPAFFLVGPDQRPRELDLRSLASFAHGRAA